MNDNEVKIALERYRNIIGYFQYENSIYWTRSSFIMLAQAAIIGFSFRLFLVQGDPTWTQLIIILIIGIIGLILGHIWKIMLQSSIYWLDRWVTILQTIEPLAYGEIEVFRGIKDIKNQNAKVHSLRKASDYVRIVFSIIWVLFLIYSFVYLIFKMCNSG